MPNKQNRQSWPLIERISPRAAALLSEDINAEAFNMKWMQDEETPHQDSARCQSVGDEGRVS